MADIIYKLKEDIDLNKLAEVQFDVLPGKDNLIFFKIVPQDYDSEIVQHTLKRLYGNKDWKQKVYDKNKKYLVEYLGLEFDKDNNIIPNSQFKEMICSWRLQIDRADCDWIGFTSMDFNDTTTFYNKKILDKFCGKEIEMLKEKDIIEEYEVVN